LIHGGSAALTSEILSSLEPQCNRSLKKIHLECDALFKTIISGLAYIALKLSVAKTLTQVGDDSHIGVEND
jgi:hypothetical protein